MLNIFPKIDVILTFCMSFEFSQTEIITELVHIEGCKMLSSI